VDQAAYLVAFYEEVTAEIRRLREEQWKLSYYFIAEGVGVIYLLSDGKVDRFINICLLVIIAVVQVLCIIFYQYHLHVNHRYLSDARNVRRKLEHYFGLHQLNFPGDEPIMPQAWKPSVQIAALSTNRSLSHWGYS
jgi:hypothetical protein